MPALQEFSVIGTAGHLEGIAHLPDSAPRAIVVMARPLHLPVVVLPGAGHFFHGRLNQIRQVVLHKFDEQRI